MSRRKSPSKSKGKPKPKSKPQPNSSGPRMRLFATCAPGLENGLFEEMKALKLAKIECQVGGCKFEGDLYDLYRANLYLASAIRVLVEIKRFPCESADELYEACLKIDWSQYMQVDQTLAVSSKVINSNITHSQYAARRVKDAVVDQFREKEGTRPDVDPESPDVQINLYLNRDRCIISLDSSLVSLHQRGYRQDIGEAPLNESLAAGILRLTGWDGRSPLIDPMCGSGTFVIEAALWAMQKPPGAIGRIFGFETWPNFKPHLLKKAHETSPYKPRKAKPPILLGFDRDGRVLKGARHNAGRAGAEDLITFEKKDLANLQLKKGWNATIIANPPYGERLGNSKRLEDTYRQLGEFLGRCPGYRAWIFTGYPLAEKAIGMTPRQVIHLKNGGLDCKLLGYEL